MINSIQVDPGLYRLKSWQKSFIKP